MARKRGVMPSSVFWLVLALGFPTLCCTSTTFVPLPGIPLTLRTQSHRYGRQLPTFSSSTFQKRESILTFRALAPIDSEIDWVERMVHHVRRWPSNLGSALARRWEETISISKVSKDTHFMGAALAQGEREYMEDMAVAVSHIPVRIPLKQQVRRKEEGAECEAAAAQSQMGRVGVAPVVTTRNHNAKTPAEGESSEVRTVDASFFSILDGHNGDSAALWGKKFLWNYVKSELKQGLHPREALREAFIRTDSTFMEQATAAEPPDESGAAVITLLVLGSDIYVAGAGDARAVLCNKGDKPPLPVSVTHRPDVPKEMARILSCGGNVTNVGGARISGILSVSRGLGDLPHKQFLTAEPDVVTVRLRPGDRYMVLGSDGVWDYLAEDEVADLVKSCVNARVAAETVATSALFAGSEDNVGCLVVDLPLLIASAPSQGAAAEGEKVAPSVA